MIMIIVALNLFRTCGDVTNNTYRPPPYNSENQPSYKPILIFQNEMLDKHFTLFDLNIVGSSLDDIQRFLGDASEKKFEDGIVSICYFNGSNRLTFFKRSGYTAYEASIHDVSATDQCTELNTITDQLPNGGGLFLGMPVNRLIESLGTPKFVNINTMKYFYLYRDFSVCVEVYSHLDKVISYKYILTSKTSNNSNDKPHKASGIK